MSRIDRIDAIIIDVPTVRGHVLSMTTMKSQSVVQVRIRFSDGSEGLGEGASIGGLSYGPESVESVKLAIDAYIAPALIGMDGDRIGMVSAHMEKAVKGNPIARAAVETALWDGLGRRSGLSVAQLFGGRIHDRLPVAWTLTPTSDCVVAVPASSFACKTGAQTVVATVAGVEALSETSWRLRLALPVAQPFLPGQYVSLSVPGTDQTRAYSFSSGPDATEASFLIRNIPGGLMSGYLGRACVGDRMELTGPMGAFYLRPVTRPQVFLAGGTGLAPFLSMLDLMVAEGTDQPIHLLYAVTRAADLVELDRLDALAARMPSLTITTIVADAASGHPKTGFVTDHLTAADLWQGAADVYLCGPPPMVEAVRDHLKALGIVPASFLFEKFNPSEKKAAA